MPLSMQIWNTYRSRLLGQYMQDSGLIVIPTISWSTEESYEFCFDGIPKGSTVAISTLGVRGNKKATELWKSGINEMIRRLEPTTILIYGDVIDYDFKNINVIYYRNEVVAKIRAIDK